MKNEDTPQTVRLSDAWNYTAEARNLSQAWDIPTPVEPTCDCDATTSYEECV